MATAATGMFVMSNLRMNGCWMPGRQRVQDLGHALLHLELRVVEVRAEVEPDGKPATLPASTSSRRESTPGEEETARSMGNVIVFSMSAGPAPL